MLDIHAQPDLAPTPTEPQLDWAEGSFRRTLVPLDGSPPSWRALGMGVSLARQHDAELWAPCAQGHVAPFPATVGEVQREKERADAHFAESRGVPLHSVIALCQPVGAVLRYARDGAFDPVLVGSGRGGLWSRLAGVASRIGQEAPCSVMVVR